MSDEQRVGPWAASWQRRVDLLTETEAGLRERPDDLALLFRRAVLSEELGMRDQAITAFSAVLIRDQGHLDAMLALGRLLALAGRTGESLIVFREATVRHPNVAPAFTAYGNLLIDSGKHDEAVAAFDRAIELDPLQLEAHRGLAIVYERAGRIAEAEAAWRRGFPDGAIAVAPFRGNRDPIRLVLVVSVVGGNIPLQHVLDDRTFQIATLIAESYTAGMAFPPHDVVLCAIGDADRCRRGLSLAEEALAQTDAAVLNPPSLVRGTTRVEVAQRLGALDGVVTAKIAAFPRAALLADDAAAALAAAGFAWPVLFRSPGYQTGEHFEKVDAAEELADAIAALPGDEILALSYLDTAAGDGTFRKYRVMSVEGKLYPLHLAISHKWKVHYFSAAMAEDEVYREEERRFLDDMAGTLGAAQVATLERIAATMGLDYGGIDFTIARDGRIVVFEANATMVILPPPNDERFEYRRPAIRRAIEAVRGMLARAAGAV